LHIADVRRARCRKEIVVKTSEKLAKLESAARTAFAVADARGHVGLVTLPSPGTTPAQKIANALRAEAIRKEAPAHVAMIKDGLTAAMATAEAELSAVAEEAEAAVAIADYITGKADELPASVPAHLAAAALALRGQDGSAVVARQLAMAARNASEEVSRMRERWLPRTKFAAKTVIHRKAEAIYSAIGDTRRATANRLMAERAIAQRDKHIETTSRKRLANG
jgi:hypothetical protein